MDPEGEYSRQLSGGDQLQAKGNFNNSTTIAADDPEPSAPPIDEEFLLSASSLDPSAEAVGNLGTEDECALTRKMAAKGHHHIVNGDDRDAFNPVAKAFACPIDSFANDDLPLAMAVPYKPKTHGLLSDDDASRENPCDAFSSTCTSAPARATKTKLTNSIRAPGDAKTASRSRLKKALIEISPEKFGTKAVHVLKCPDLVVLFTCTCMCSLVTCLCLCVMCNVYSIFSLITKVYFPTPLLS